MSKFGLARFFSTLIVYAPIVIFFASIFIALFILDITRTANGFLDSNYHHHMHTRSIIKANLLVQRGMGQATFALQGHDENSFYDALDLIEGGQSYLSGQIEGNNKIDSVSLLIQELLEELELLGQERFSGRKTSSSLAALENLQNSSNEIFSLLVAEDNRNWSETVFESGQKNESLKKLYVLFFLMCFFLAGIVLLIAIAAGKSQKAEKGLQDLAQELEGRIDERTEALSWAYQELVMQSALLQTILDTIPAPIFYKDTQGTYLGCNKAFERYIGLPKDKVVGATVYDIAPKELADIYHRADLDLIRQGETQVYETSVRYADSSLHDVIFHKAVFHHQDGSIGGQVGAMLDITEHKKAEAELLRREQIFHGLFDQTFSFMGLLSPEGILLEANNTAMALVDEDLDQVLGKPFWETAWWTHDPKLQQKLREAISRAAAGQVVRYETTHRRGEQLLAIDFSLKPIRNEQGKVIFLIPEGRDITRIKQHEKMLLSIAEGISSHTGEEFFKTLVLTMAETVNADYAMVSQFKNGQDIMETLAFCHKGSLLENREYSLENTPCQTTISQQRICSIPSGVTQLFPDNLFLPQLEVDGYVGIPLYATNGDLLGTLVAFFGTPIQDVSTAEQLVRIFGVRAAVELERLRNQRRLEESEKSFRTIFQASPDTAVVARLEDKIIVDCNDGFYQLTGYNKEEVIGKSSVDVGMWVDPEDRNRMHEILLQKGRVENFEFLGRKKNGEIANSLLSLRIINLRDVPHMLVVTRDITEVKRAQHALKDSEQRYRELYTQFQVLLDGIPDALLLFSRDLKVVWANQGAANHFSKTVEELAGLSCHDLWLDDSRMCDACTSEVFQQGIPLDKTFKVLDGRHWGIKTFPIRGNDGTVVNCIQIASDITEKICLREHANQASRLASLGELSAGVAHEINNPNAQLLLNLPMVADAIADSLPILDRYRDTEGDFSWGGVNYSRMRHEIPKLLEEMQDAAGRIRTIVEDLKNFARSEGLDQGQIFSLNEALETAVRLSGNTIKGTTDNFNVEYGEDLPLIECVCQRIEQVLVNLIINACQALSKRSEGIFVRTWHEKEQGMVYCEIQDEGIGMSEEILEHVTDPFFTTRREVGGTGLGLSISARIVKEHGGEMVISSQPGQGTRVAVCFRV